MNLSMQDDYKCWDNVESVTYTHVARTGNAEDTIPVVKRRSVKVGERSPSGGVYVAGDVVFLVPAVLLPASVNPPKPADVVADEDGTRFTVLQVGQNKRSITRGQAACGTWRLEARDLVVAHELADRIDIQRAVVTLDPSGVAVRAWPPEGGSTPYPSLPCRVQLLTDEEAEERGIRGLGQKFKVVLSKQVELTKEDRIQWVEGNRTRVLRIESLHDPEQIADLPWIDAVGEV